MIQQSQSSHCISRATRQLSELMHGCVIYCRSLKRQHTYVVSLCKQLFPGAGRPNATMISSCQFRFNTGVASPRLCVPGDYLQNVPLTFYFSCFLQGLAISRAPQLMRIRSIFHTPVSLTRIRGQQLGHEKYCRSADFTSSESERRLEKLFALYSLVIIS